MPKRWSLKPVCLPVPPQEQRAGRGSRTLVTSLEGWGNSRYTTPAMGSEGLEPPTLSV
jgi:hypothetical protein